jgi:hypothetical protein
MSNGDKRSVHTDALETLGTIIGPNEQRDAIHLAVEPAVAGQTLKPGQDVGFLPDGTVGACKRDDLLGIVDPFLPQPIHKGDRFWLIVYPRQITSLRHVWTHPAFDKPKDVVTQVEADPAVNDEPVVTEPKSWKSKCEKPTFKEGDKVRGIKGLGEAKLVNGTKITVEWEDGSMDMWFDHMLHHVKPESEAVNDEDEDDDDDEDWVCSC